MQFNDSDAPARRRRDSFMYRPSPGGGNSSDTPARRRRDPFIYRPGSEQGSGPDTAQGPSLDSAISVPGLERDDKMDTTAGPRPDLPTDVPQPARGNSSDILAGPRPGPSMSTPGPDQGNGLEVHARPRFDPFLSLPWLEANNSSDEAAKHWLDPFVQHPRSEPDSSPYIPGRRRIDSLLYPPKEGSSLDVLVGSQPDPQAKIPGSGLGNSSEKGNGLEIPAPQPRLDSFISLPGLNGGNTSKKPAKRRLDPFIYRPGSEREKSSSVPARRRLDRSVCIPGSGRSNSSDSYERSRLDRLMKMSGPERGISVDTHEREWPDHFAHVSRRQERNNLDASARRRRDPFIYLPGSERGRSLDSSARPRLHPIMSVSEPEGGTNSDSSDRPGSERAPPQPARPAGGRRGRSAETRPGGDQGEDVPARIFRLWPPTPPVPVPAFRLADLCVRGGPKDDSDTGPFSAPPTDEEVWPHRALFFSPPSPLPDPPTADAVGSSPAPGTSGEADSVNPEKEGSSCWSNFSVAMLTGDQEETSAEQVGEDCEDDETASRRQEVLEEPNPVVKLERYAYSDIVFNRQLVARNIVETLRAVLDSQEAVDAVLTALSSLSLDCEPSVRTELVEQLPNIASFCADEGGLLQNVVREHVVPILVQYLTDVANQVRKRTQVSLLFILERKLIDHKQLQEQICSLVVHLTESENVDDYRIEAVTLMTKMAPYVGKDTAADLFLPRFLSLCQDSSFHMRKVCAANFGDFCSIVGQEYTEDNLNIFQMLCEDCVWGVRKACAEVFMPVSCVCSLATRRNTLAPIFMNLLDDQSRWVRTAAFQTLGCFISTFADPQRTGLYCSEDGVVSVRAVDGPSGAGSDEEAAASLEETVSLKGTGIQGGVAATDADPVNCGEAFDGAPAMPKQFEGTSIQKDVPGEQHGCIETVGPKEALSVEGDRQRLLLHVDSGADSNFNTFQFWRLPIPELEVDIQFLGSLPTAVHVRARSQSQGNRCFTSDLNVEVLGADGKQITATGALYLNQDSGISSERLSADSTLRIRTASLSSLTSADQECNVLLSSSVTEASVAFNEAGEVAGVHKIRMSNSKEVAGTENTLLAKSLNSSSDSWSAHQQDIVPVLLLERYQTMTDPSLAQNLDSEIGRHCAHSLPAVALTLGQRFWPCLRTTYLCLVSDVQWKVRHIMASCLHELAAILGPQIASRDLVPSFEGFVRDVDEVRVGLLERLSFFLGALSRADQRRTLPLIADFLLVDNHRNWRFRFTIARQLKEIALLYGPLDVHRYLVPLVSDLLVDKVAEVRRASVEAAVVVLQRLGPHMCQEFLQKLCKAALDTKWSQRQLFCVLAEKMVTGECISEEDFIVTVLPKLLHLRHDSVPNVRMALASCLVRGIWPKAYFWGPGNIYRDELRATLAGLQEDTDRDVRFCARFPQDTVD